MRRTRLQGLALSALATALLGCGQGGGGHGDAGLDGPAGEGDVLPDLRPADLRLVDLATADFSVPADGGTEGMEAGAGIDLGLACTAPLGTGSISGTVQGQSFTATHAAGLSFGQGIQGYMIFFAVQASCTTLGQPPLPAFGLTLCDTAPGAYPVEASCAAGDLLSVKSGVSVILDGPDLKASSGTIFIEVFAPGCGGQIKGSFQADFSGEAVSGTFDAVGCSG